MTPTRAEIMSARTEKGGWTRAQLAAWGVAWPPKKGWIDRLLAHDDAHESIINKENIE